LVHTSIEKISDNRYIDGMRIGFVCNQNLARSQVMCQYFSQQLPDDTLTSYGLIAQEGSPLPKVIKSVLEEWGLDSGSLVAKNVFKHLNELVACDLIFAMSSFITETLISSGFTGQLINIETESARLGIQLNDPQLMPQKRCSFELAKYLFVAQAAMQRVAIRNGKKTIKAIIPESERSLLNAAKVALTERKAESVIIYSDFVAPQNDLFLNSNLQVSKIIYSAKHNSFTITDPETNPIVVIPSHAEVEPSKLYLSKSWFGFRSELSGRDLILLTPPLASGSTFLHQSFLAALCADEVQIVS